MPKKLSSHFKPIDYTKLNQEIIGLMSRFPDYIKAFEGLRDRVKANQKDPALNPDGNAQILEKWAVDVQNGNRVKNWQPTIPTVSDCASDMAEFFPEFALNSKLNGNAASNAEIETLFSVLQSEQLKVSRFLSRLSFLVQHFAPPLLDESFAGKLFEEVLEALSTLKAIDLVSIFENHYRSMAVLLEQAMLQGGQYQDSYRSILAEEETFLQTLACELQIFIDDMKSFVNYMQKNNHFITDLQEIIEKVGISSTHQ